MLIQSTSKLTGTPGESGWAQIHEFVPADPEKLQKRGKLFAVISTSHAEIGVDTISSGRELLTRYHEEYYGKTEGKPFDVLREATQKVADEFRSTWGDIEIVSAAVVGNVVYTAAIGGAGVLILRNGALGKILESEKEKVIVASGFPQNADVVLLASKPFLARVPQGVIKAALSAESAQIAVESLGPMVLGEHNVGNLGAEIIMFKDEAVLTEPRDLESEETLVSDRPQAILKTKFSADFFKKAQASINLLLRKVPQRNIYLKAERAEEISPQSKKLTFTIAAILLALLAVSIGFGIRQKRINDLKSRYQGILTAANNEVDQAISLASVSSDKSRELFADSEQKLNQIEAMKVNDPQVDALKEKINNSRAAVLGEYLASPQMFLDLTLLSSGFKGDTIAFSGGFIYVLDRSGQRIVSVDISNKKSKVVAGPGEVSSAQGLACYEDKVYTLENDGIYEVDAGVTKVIDKSWPGDALISAFAGNMYVIDKSSSSIYRYQGSGGSFGDKQNWLASGTNVNLTDISQMAIDGSVYALSPNSQILKFAQGSPQNFSITGVVPEIGNIDAISASPDNQDLYLLDRAGGRVVVTDKKGAYIAQYVDPLISQSVGLVVSEADKKIILLTGDKLYSIDLQNN